MIEPRQLMYLNLTTLNNLQTITVNCQDAWSVNAAIKIEVTIELLLKILHSYHITLKGHMKMRGRYFSKLYR